MMIDSTGDGKGNGAGALSWVKGARSGSGVADGCGNGDGTGWGDGLGSGRGWDVWETGNGAGWDAESGWAGITRHQWHNRAWGYAHGSGWAQLAGYGYASGYGGDKNGRVASGFAPGSGCESSPSLGDGFE